MMLMKTQGWIDGGSMALLQVRKAVRYAWVKESVHLQRGA